MKTKKIIVIICTIVVGLIVYKITSPEPLYVVNGVIVNKKQFQQYKPEKIVNTMRFEGEAATAIYGEKGKNGVILITLKQ